MEKKYYLLIFLGSALLIGYTYGFDLPQALEVPLREQPFNYSSLQFNLLYFFQFLPDILFQIPIGILVDKYPLRGIMYFFATLTFTALLLSGLSFQLMFSGYKYVVYFLRSLFGVSGEALFTVQAVLLTLYAGKHYEVSMGICLTLPFVFDALNSVITTHVFDATKDMALTWYIAAFMAFLSIFTAIWIDKIYLRKKNEEKSSETQKNLALNSSSPTEISDQLIEQQQQSQESKQQQLNCKNILNLSSQFWVLCGAIFSFEAALGPYFDNMNEMIVKRFGIDYTDAGKMLIVPQALLVVFGYMLSKTCSIRPHWRRKILLITSIIYFILISIIYLLPNTKEPTAIYYIAICAYLLLMSMMFACSYCSLVGSTSYFVPKSQLGIAYGVAATALCTCQCIGPLVNSAIMNLYKQLDKSYELLSLFGAGLAIFPVIFSLWIYRDEFQILDYNLKDHFVQNRLEKMTKNAQN